MARKASNREFDLVAACCRPPERAARTDAVRQTAAPGGLDWQHVLRLAQRHRVEPLVLDGLRSAGVELPAEAGPLVARVAAGATDRLALTAETLHLDALLDAAGVDRLFFKGATLEQLAYRRSGFKQSRDIDVLIDEKDLDRVGNILAERGYVCELPSPVLSERMRTDSARRRTFLRVEKEAVWRRGNLVVEIHWRLANSRFLLPGLNVSAPRQLIELLPGRNVPTLASPELFAYLVTHGALHGWFRLKWLADLVALVDGMRPEELAEAHDRAVSLRVGRCSAQALLLGERILGLELPRAWAAGLRSERAVSGMVEFATVVLTAAVPAGEVEMQPRFRGRLLRSQWRSSRHSLYRLELLATCWRRVREWASAHIPAAPPSRRAVSHAGGK